MRLYRAEMVEIARVETLSLSAIHPLVEQSVNEGFRFLQRLVDDWVAGANRFDRHGEALFIASCEGLNVGICGLNHDPFIADKSVGRLRHLYVLPTHRRHGIGRLLVSHTIEFARPHFHRIRLRTDSAQAASFYERLGLYVSQEPESTHELELSHL